MTDKFYIIKNYIMITIVDSLRWNIIALRIFCKYIGGLLFWKQLVLPFGKSIFKVNYYS